MSGSTRGRARERARVLVVGVGGLGCPAAIALAHAGIGTIGIADDDEIDASNLHRQILFGEADVGRSKIDVAAQRLAERSPYATIRAHEKRLLPDDAVALVSEYDVVVEGSDNFATKFLAADACAIARVPIVHGAAVRWHGTALAVSARGAPCYRCLFEDLPQGDAPNCAEAGVVGPVVGIVAALQADLALAIVDGRDVGGTLVTFDGKTDALRKRRIQQRASCTLCGSTPRIRSIDVHRYRTGDTHACAG